MWAIVLLLIGIVFGAWVVISPLWTAFREIRRTGKVSDTTNGIVGITYMLVGALLMTFFGTETVRTGAFLYFVGTIASFALFFISVQLPFGFTLRNES